jgi:hypothetical protein
LEHRFGTRHPVDVPAYVRTQDGLPSGFGRLREVSASGGFVETRLDVEPLSRVAVQLLTHGHSASQPVAPHPHPTDPPSSPLIVEAQVTGLSPRGVYVEWTEYAPELVRHLLEHQSDRLADRSPAAADSKDGVPGVLAPLVESLGSLERWD